MTRKKNIGHPKSQYTAQNSENVDFKEVVLNKGNNKTNNDLKESNKKEDTTHKEENQKEVIMPKGGYIKRWHENGYFGVVEIILTFLIFFVTAGSAYLVKKHFDITNHPYLQLRNISIDSFKVGKRMEFSYELDNIGSYPVKVLETKFVTSFRASPPDYYNSLNELSNYPNEAVITIVSKEFPINRIQPSVDTVTVGQDLLIKKGYYFYITGYFKYLNLSNNKISTYKFQVETVPKWGKYTYNFIINENVDE